MRLKKIKLSGFKSFVDSTTVAFPQQMTCIVGPNGCGKSNVIDAVRWVLGESSAKNLRGDSMTDVIFNGSGQRSPNSQASVELVFDNTEGKLQGSLADRTEISIKRQVTRKPETKYFLNGEKCRRKDIIDIFLGTGMGARSYAIIEQGMVSKLIESKPQELRVFLEEAAGISKYKERRKETENRIRHTEDNLARLGDVMHELTKSLDKLKRQSANAIKYKDLKAKQKQLKSDLAALRFKTASDQTIKVEAQISEKRTELESYKADSTKSDSILIALKTERDEGLQEQDELQKHVFLIEKQISQAQQEVKHLKQRQAHLQSEIEKTQHLISQATEIIEEETAEIEEIQLDVDSSNPELEILREKYEAAQEQLDDAESSLQEFTDAYNQLTSRSSELKHKLSTTENNIVNDNRMLSQTTERLDDLKEELSITISETSNESSEALSLELESAQLKLDELTSTLDELKEQESSIKQEVKSESSKLSELTKSQNKIAGTLESLQYLQEKAEKGTDELNAWLSDSNISAKSLLSEIKVKDGWGKAVEAALSLIGNPIAIDKEPDNLPDVALSAIFSSSREAKTGTLASVVTGDYIPELFNFIAISDEVEAPMHISTSGLIKSSNWVYTGKEDSQSGYFARKTEIEELSHQHEQIVAQLEEITNKIDTLSERENALLNQIMDVSSQSSAEQQKVTTLSTELRIKEQQADAATKKIDRLKSQISSLQAEVTTTEQRIEINNELVETTRMSLEECEEQLLESENTLSQSKNHTQTVRSTTMQYKDNLHRIEMESSSKRSKLDGLKASLQKTTTEINRHKENLDAYKSELDASHTPIEEHMEDEQIKLQELSDAQEKLDRFKISMSGILEKISDAEAAQASSKEYESRIAEAINDLKIHAERHMMKGQQHLAVLNELKVNIKDYEEFDFDSLDESVMDADLESTTKAIDRLGAVNLAAIEEYEQESKRKEYLDQQVVDLEGALETLRDAIDKIDKETRTRFKETYEKVNADFQVLFPRVFGGGAAYLELTDSDLLEAGVTIMARPPGKKNSTIHLLSGGEKALTAISLVFSIFRLNPAPFCMLDEVDAPLDDVNVQRFCNLVESMSDTVQFVYISHNKVAMEMAHQLAGVTMQEPGVSRLVAVDVEEAAKLID